MYQNISKTIVFWMFSVSNIKKMGLAFWPTLYKPRKSSSKAVVVRPYDMSINYGWPEHCCTK